MEEFGADPIYMMLCEQQQCYRARVTPKPMRIGFKRNTPFSIRKGRGDNDGDFNIGEDRAERWIKVYDQARRGYRTCYLIHRFGGHPDQFSELLDLHDRLTGISEYGVPLA